MDERPEAAYLAGMIDGEGSVSLRGSVTISNLDRDLIEACADSCNRLGIAYKVRRQERLFSRSPGGRLLANGSGLDVRHRTEWTLYIGARSLPRLAACVRLRSARKQKLLEHVVGPRTLPGQLALFLSATDRASRRFVR